MEAHVNIEFFQAQVKSLLDILLNVAVAEITRIFQCTVRSDTGNSSIRNSEVLECTFKNALERMGNSAMSPNDESTNYRTACSVRLQQDEETDRSSSTSKETDSDIPLNTERENARWEITGTTLDSSLLRGNSEHVASHEPSAGLRILSVFSSPLDNALKAEDLEVDTITASTPPTLHTSPSGLQETNARLLPSRRVLRLEAKLSEPSDVKEELDAEPVSLPEFSQDSEDLEDLTLNTSSASSPTLPFSSLTLPFSSPTLFSPSTTMPFSSLTLPSPSTTLLFSSPTLFFPSSSTTSTHPPPAGSSPLLRPRACSVRLLDIGNTLAPLGLPSRHFVCQDCGKVFWRRREFRRHRRFHTGEKRYGCGWCRRFYALKSSLRLHRSEAHSDREHHLCEVCGKSFTDLRQLTSHARSHTGRNPSPARSAGKSSGTGRT